MAEPHTHGGTDAPECTTCRGRGPAVTAPERLAKVAASIAARRLPGCEHSPACCARCLAAALAPLLGEFQAEDESRGAARVREAVEAQIRHMLAVPPDVTEVSRELMAADLHIALDAAEKENHDG